MRRNRAIQAEKKAPRVLKRMKEAMEAGKKHNVSYNSPRVLFSQDGEYNKTNFWINWALFWLIASVP